MGDKPDIRNDGWLRECSNDILYEYWMMLFGTFARHGDRAVQNALMEVGRLHWRSLATFFYAEHDEAKRKNKMRITNIDQKNEGQDADLLPRYYIRDWRPLEPADWGAFWQEYERTQKQIAHLSLFRARQRRPFEGDGQEHLNRKVWHPAELAEPIIASMGDFLTRCKTDPTARRRIDWDGGNFRRLVHVERDLLAAGALSQYQCVAQALSE